MGVNGRSSNLQQRLSVLPGLTEVDCLRLLLVLSLSCNTRPFLVSRFSFAHACSAIHHHSIVRTCVRAAIALTIAHYCTAAWKPFASCFIAVPCDWLAARVCTICSPPVVCCTSLRCPPCLPQKCLLACLLATCYLLPAPPTYYYLRQNPALSAAYPQLHPLSQPAISRTIVSAARIPSIVPSIQTLPCFTFASPCSLPWRTSPGLSSFFRVAHGGRATPCAAPGNYTRTTCGTCRPRGKIARLGRVRPTMRRANRVPVA